MSETKKIFVLDTNVILHDYHSIYNFEENDVVIPITVLEELDNFKKGNEEKNFHARAFMRELDKISGKELFTTGISLGKGLGNLIIEPGKQFSDKMKESFSEDKPDHRILAVAEFLHYKNHDRKVVLISQDINLRMKAKAIGIAAEDYETGKIHDFEKLYKGQDEIKIDATDLINKIYHSKEGIPYKEIEPYYQPKTNEYFVLKSDNSSVLLFNNSITKKIEQVESYTAYGIKPRNSEQKFAMNALMNPDIN